MFTLLKLNFFLSKKDFIECFYLKLMRRNNKIFNFLKIIILNLI